MKKLLPLFILFLGCTSSPHKTQEEVPVLTIDVCKNYPPQVVNAHEIADIQYIAPNLVGESFSGNSVLNSKISDKYLITHDLHTGDIFFFDTSGKLIRTFNHTGNGPTQYHYVIQLVADFKKEELFINDYKRHRILVYSFTGDYLRTLPFDFVGDKGMLVELLDYDSDYLMAKYDSLRYSNELGNTKYPYRLISKKDGTMEKINLLVDKPLTPLLYQDTLYSDGNKRIYTVKGKQLSDLRQLLKNGDEILIADQGLDTIYSFKSGTLTPIISRTPLIRTMEKPVIINPRLLTDDYFYFALLDATPPSDPYIYYKIISEYVLNRKNGEISNWVVTNADQGTKRELALTPIGDMGLAFETGNQGFSFISAKRLVNDYKAGYLQGELKEVASQLTPDGMDVLMIYKFK